MHIKIWKALSYSSGSHLCCTLAEPREFLKILRVRPHPRLIWLYSYGLHRKDGSGKLDHRAFLPEDFTPGAKSVKNQNNALVANKEGQILARNFKMWWARKQMGGSGVEQRSTRLPQPSHQEVFQGKEAGDKILSTLISSIYKWVGRWVRGETTLGLIFWVIGISADSRNPTHLAIFQWLIRIGDWPLRLSSHGNEIHLLYSICVIIPDEKGAQDLQQGPT